MPKGTLLLMPVFSIYKVYFSLHQKLRERLLLDITSAKWNPQRNRGQRNSVQKLSRLCNFVHVGAWYCTLAANKNILK